jgi:DNA-binding transcriptional regulator PaaX
MAMDYNELKLRVLQILAGRERMSSGSIAMELRASTGLVIDIHALRMALMRYHKQGLLKRERGGGMFAYTLSERGLQRLRWLEHQKR